MVNAIVSKPRLIQHDSGLADQRLRPDNGLPNSEDYTLHPIHNPLDPEQLSEVDESRADCKTDDNRQQYSAQDFHSLPPYAASQLLGHTAVSYRKMSTWPSSQTGKTLKTKADKAAMGPSGNCDGHNRNGAAHAAPSSAI